MKISDYAQYVATQKDEEPLYVFDEKVSYKSLQNSTVQYSTVLYVTP